MPWAVGSLVCHSKKYGVGARGRGGGGTVTSVRVIALCICLFFFLIEAVVYCELSSGHFATELAFITIHTAYSMHYSINIITCTLCCALNMRLRL